MPLINEIFASIQGESTLQGLPTVFVRLSGCNLKCSYCDTGYACEEGLEMKIDDILEIVTKYKMSRVCITGGEPLLQEDTPALASAFISAGFNVSVETNGTLDASVLPAEVKRVIDIKCPGSGEHGKTHPSNLSAILPEDEFKFVLTDRKDFVYARDFSEEHSLTKIAAVLLSPAYNNLDPALLVDWIISDMPEARLNLQLHKYIWPYYSRGK